MWPFRKKKQAQPVEVDKQKIIGVILGWDMKPHICFADHTYLPSGIEQKLYPEYFTNDEWPVDPVTKEKLPIVEEEIP